MILPPDGAPHERGVVCVHTEVSVDTAFTAVTAGGTPGELVAKLANIKGATASVYGRAWDLCRRLDKALEARDASDAAVSVDASSNGAILIEFNAPGFLLFFAVEESEEDSGWGLATHKSSGGLIAGGPLSSIDCASVLGLILPQRRLFRLLSFEGPSRQITAVV